MISGQSSVLINQFRRYFGLIAKMFQSRSVIMNNYNPLSSLTVFSLAENLQLIWTISAPNRLVSYLLADY